MYKHKCLLFAFLVATVFKFPDFYHEILKYVICNMIFFPQHHSMIYMSQAFGDFFHSIWTW